MTHRRTATACLALVALAVLLGATTRVQPDPWPQRITDDMTAVQTNETSLGAKPRDATAWRECVDHVRAYDADTAAAPGSIPAGLPAHMTAADACGPAPK